MRALSGERTAAGLRHDWDHACTELDELLALLEHEPTRLPERWGAFERELLGLLAREERVLHSHRVLDDLRGTVAMGREHVLLRARIEQASCAVEACGAVATELRILAAELRAHRAHEGLSA